MKKISLNLLVFVSLFSLVSAHTGSEDYGGCGMYGMMSGAYGMGFGIFGWLFSLLILVALILLIAWLIKQIQKK